VEGIRILADAPELHGVFVASTGWRQVTECWAEQFGCRQFDTWRQMRKSGE